MGRVDDNGYTRIEEVKGRHNGFGVLRLFFASLVIVTHTCELRYGYRSHEPLITLTGTISLGDLAVDGFFIVSGYLIVGSFLKRPDAWAYLRQRIARIYPAFAVASLFTVLIVAPLAGATRAEIAVEGAKTIKRILFLQPPAVQGIFAGTPFPVLDGAMWTISHEFRCYLIVLLLGMIGALRRPWLIVAIAIGLLLAFEIVPLAYWQRFDGPISNLLIGDMAKTIRLTGIFLMGSVFYLWKDRIVFGATQAAVASVALMVCLFFPRLAEPAVATLGAYTIFSFAANCTSGILSRINNKSDISYGIYLYAWPLEKLFMFYFPSIGQFPVGLLTVAAACLCGWLSWHYVESPVMHYLKRRSRLPGNPVGVNIAHAEDVLADRSTIRPANP